MADKMVSPEITSGVLAAPSAASLPAYEVSVKGWPAGTATVFAASAGKAKYQRFLALRDCWPDFPITRLSCRSLGIIPVPPTRTEQAQCEADAFNRRYPIGTMLRYWSWLKEGPPTGVAPISHKATVIGESAVIWLTGISSCHAISHVEADNA